MSTKQSTTKKIFFPKQMEYNGKIYTAGETYDIEVANGFADRWIKRGCVEIAEKKIEQKPHTHTHVKKPEVKKEEKLPVEPKKDEEIKQTEQNAADIL